MKNLENERKEVETKLSFNPKEEATVSDIQKEFIMDEIKELTPIKEGDVNISSAYIFEEEDKLEVSIYIRNGLSKSINFERVPLLLINSKGEEIASDIFDLQEVGEIPPFSVRPFKIYFSRDKIEAENFDVKDLKIVFDKGIEAKKYVDVSLEDLPKDFDENTIFALQNYVNNLPKIEQEQVSISTFFVRNNEDESISVTLIIRNGSKNKLTIDKIPLKVYDGEDKLAAKGVFENININVNPFKAIVREFVFMKEQRSEGNFDFKTWRVEFN
ncbi:SLAP domain-containing protein [Haloimpatiens sp. FM7315]|uniref:SLAP domain-containing protein n=1 Tax=Haloimpatiens sp. FM7315 TaxID=3298609 RepID=UPI0035A29C27